MSMRLWLQWCHSHVILRSRWKHATLPTCLVGKFWLATRTLQTLSKRHVEFKAIRPVDLLLSGLSRIIHCNLRVVPKRLYLGAFRGWRMKSRFKFNRLSFKIGCWLIFKGRANSESPWSELGCTALSNRGLVFGTNWLLQAAIQDHGILFVFLAAETHSVVLGDAGKAWQIIL